MDTKLSLKPIELIDIGIDKHTKMPMPILFENFVYTNENSDGIPIDSFQLTSNSVSFYLQINCIRDITLTINFGDNTGTTIMTGTTFMIVHSYPSTIKKIIQITGDLEKITGLTCLGDVTGLTKVDIIKLKKLNYLNLSGNTLNEVDITGLINLNYINLSNNKLNASSTDDIFIQANTFLNYSGTIDVSIGNEPPSTYSLIARTNLQNIKNWTLNI